jgi:hypothetical protein
LSPPRARSSGSTLRWSALLGAGALGVHELQYRVSFGADADRILAARGHGYLAWAIALASVLATLAAVRLVLEVGAARRHGRRQAQARRGSFRWQWACSTAMLMLVYLLQESLEGALGAAHPGVLHALSTHNGWLVLVVAVALGLAIAALMRGADEIVDLAARSAHARRRPRRASPASRPVARRRFARLEVLAEHLAGRAPPAPCP